MIATPEKLTLTLHDPPFKVSNLSSLFRSLQAAVRETAAAGEPVESLFSNQQGPFLVTDVANGTDGELTMSLWFVDRDNQPLMDRSEETFVSAISELERTILRGSQHTFWGAPAYQSEIHEDDSRMLRFIAVLRAFRSATISYDGRNVVLRDGLFASERA
ncbi:MAG: hypothetical protein F4Y63_07445 [Chloroflexi bacterium]|nr:hypothetical protein [Chloroflexota bacterium]MYF78754.1 hypothetical protein [Chloroflexota bacterium]